MKISDVAKNHGISIQRVYKKLSDAKIDVKTLKDNKTGDLTADGEAVINQLFNMRFKKLNQSDATVITGLKAEVEKLEMLISTLKEKNDLLRQQCDTLKAQVVRLENDVDHERIINLSLMQRLKATQTQPVRHGFIARLLSGRKEG